MFLISIIICIFVRAVFTFHLFNINQGEVLVPYNTFVRAYVPATLDGYTNRIIGGQKAAIEDFPHQVALEIDDSFCGGFIISENYVATAAHCIHSLDPSVVELRAGSSWQTEGTLIDVAEVIVHPGFDPEMLDKDIALLRTSEPIEFNESIQPIELPPKGRPLVANSMVEVSGWGRVLLWIHYLPEHLRSVEIPVVDFEQCRSAYSMLTENVWCGGYYYTGGKAPCKGDSGGAAIQDGMAVGIVSYSIGCAYPLNPAVFVDIAAPEIRDFITEETGL